MLHPMTASEMALRIGNAIPIQRSRRKGVESDGVHSIYAGGGDNDEAQEAYPRSALP